LMEGLVWLSGACHSDNHNKHQMVLKLE